MSPDTTPGWHTTKLPGAIIAEKGLDGSKDQSYVLYNLTQEQLAHTQFPVGELSKHRVREIAEEHGFLNADKPDSPGHLLCAGRGLCRIH